jgi:hypothetical protein
LDTCGEMTFQELLPDITQSTASHHGRALLALSVTLEGVLSAFSERFLRLRDPEHLKKNVPLRTESEDIEWCTFSPTR